jgi:hypothetical protein
MSSICQASEALGEKAPAVTRGWLTFSAGAAD